MASSSQNEPGSGKLGLVVIGRNEGERLARCLASVRTVERRIYVDSGSTDDSVALARKERIKVIELSRPPQFSAARARNAGLAQLLVDEPDLEFVQMVDGDCEVQPRWIESALEALRREPELALVFGRLRERFPERSVYNALCDDMWNVPVGYTEGVGGNALFRVAALRAVDFYRTGMIAGEELELAYRLRTRGWQLRAIDAEMALHDADMTRFAQWWARARRSGYGCTELVHLHPGSRDSVWRRAFPKILIWGGAIPGIVALAILLALTVDVRWWIVAVLAFLPWPLNVVRITLREKRRGLTAKAARASGLLLMLGWVAQLLGLIDYYYDRRWGRAPNPIK